MNIDFGAWEPDRAGQDTSVLALVYGAFPSSVGWMPAPTFARVGTDALPTACNGIFFARTEAGSWRIFGTTTTDIYEYVSDAWDSRTNTGGPYATAAGAIWRGDQWKNLLILVNGTDTPQYLDVDDAGADEFLDLDDNPPAALDVRTINNVVFLLDATDRRRIIHCGTTGPNAAASWTVGTDLCDEYFAYGGSEFMSLPFFGEYGIALQKDEVATRFVFQPGDANAMFRIEKLDGIKGASSVYATSVASGRVFYRSAGSFWTLDANGQNAPIGAQRVDQWFLDNTDQSRIDQVVSFVDTYSSRVYWHCYATSASGSRDVLVGHDFLLDRWFLLYVTADILGPTITASTLLDDLDDIYGDLDSIPISLDSPIFSGGKPLIGGVDTDGYMAFLNGTAAEAQFLTPPVEPNPEGWTYVSDGSLVGRIGASAPTLRVGRQRNSADDISNGNELSRHAETGIFPIDTASRLFTFRLTIPAGGPWKFLQSLRTKDAPDGER